MWPVDVVKKSITAFATHYGTFETSTTTWAPCNTSANPWPVNVLTPVSGAAATVWWPRSLRLLTSFDPMRLVPPMTTIFIWLPHRPAVVLTLNVRDARPYLGDARSAQSGNSHQWAAGRCAETITTTGITWWVVLKRRPT